LLARFVALCREHGTKLVVVFSPLNRQNVRDDHAADNARILEQVARLTPVWDSTGRPGFRTARIFGSIFLTARPRSPP